MRLFISSLSKETSTVEEPIIKDFRYGADYAISSNSDQFQTPSANEIEYISWKYSVRSTMYEFASTSPVNRDVYTQDVFEESIYWRTDRYHNAASIVSIPDYYDATWSAAGVAAFPNAVLGAAKPLRYPNIGTQQMYISGGLIGVQLDVVYTDWDMGVGYEGINNPTTDPDTSKETASIIATGTNGNGLPDYTPTSSQGHKTFSYRNGQEGSWQVYASALIGGRNSSTGSQLLDTFYDEWDLTQRSQSSYPSSIRIADAFFDAGWTDEQRVAWVKDKIETQTIPTNGWFRNFTHWHTASMTLMDLFYESLQQISDTETELCWFAGMSEATEYRWFRNMITGVNFSGSAVTIQINNKYSLDLSQIITPISVEVDLSGTALSGKDITASHGRVRSLGSDKFIVEVSATSLSTTINETVIPDYVNFNYPVLLTDDFVTDTLTVTTDALTRATLFSDEIGTVVERKYTNSDSHIFTGLSSGQTYYLGIMSRENRSIVQAITT